MIDRRRRPAWPAPLLLVALAAMGWWLASDDPDALPPGAPVASAPAEDVGPRASAVTAPPATARPPEHARPASAFKLVGTVMAANRADSFALVRHTADSRLVTLRAGDRLDGLTVSAIESGSVVLAGAGRAIVVEAETTNAASAPAPVPGPFLATEPEPAWAGDPAPFGH